MGVWLFAAGAFVGSFATYLYMSRVMKGALEWAGQEYIRVAGERDRLDVMVKTLLELEEENEQGI